MEPTGKISRPDWMEAPETRRVMAALTADGGEARFAGGCVRDALVNRRVYDIDIATPLTPQQVMALLDRARIRHVPTGLDHGTVTAVVDGHPFEITTLRVDIATDGRRAEVAFTDNWREDAARRDFTMNAMFCDLEGNLYDAFGGTADLRQGIVRFVGDPHARIVEDVLRILRFFRFHAHYGQGDPDPAALAACGRHARELPRLSAERVTREVLKLLESDRAAPAWQAMAGCGVLAQVLPVAIGSARLTRLIALEERFSSKTDVMRRLAALIGDDLEHVREALTRLRLSSEQTARLKLYAREGASGPFEDAAALRRVVFSSGNDAVRSFLLLWTAAGRLSEEALPAFYQEATAFRAPRLPLTGVDVMKAGVPAGPEVGRVLAAVQNWWMERDFAPTRAECLTCMAEVLSGPADLGRH